MAIEKSRCTVISFPNTNAALAMESACKRYGIPGRIIPVPDIIDAGCGFAWRADASDRERLASFIQENGLVYAGIYTVDI